MHFMFWVSSTTYIESESLFSLESEKPLKWTFDVEDIKKGTMIVDTIADSMLLRKSSACLLKCLNQ